MGTLVHGRAEGGVLHTAGYVTRLTAQLRGAVRAALTPTTRETLVQHALVASTPAGAELTGSIVRDLANDAAVASGSFRGGAWHPTAYGRTKSFAVKEAYARDGLVTTATARRLGVDNLGEYFNTELDPHGFALANSFVSKSTLERLDDAAWLDPSFPARVSPAARPRALAKAREHGLFLGMTWDWLHRDPGAAK